MNTILWSGLLLGEVIAIGQVSLRATFEWNWDHTNKCGPRPHGPFYPYPDGPGNYSDPGNCDIVPEHKYFYNYECETTCQMDRDKTVRLTCHCLTQVGPIQKVEPCEWKYEGDVCPDVPLEEQKYDWDCDPREGGLCPDGQYPGGPISSGANPWGMYSWQTQMMNPNMTGGMMPGMGGMMPGYINHIYIQPVMQQEIGNVEDPEDDNSYHGGSSGVAHMHHHVTPEEEAQFAADLAEAKEQTRSYKSAIKAAEDSMKRERLRYAEQLDEKEKSRLDLLNQLHVMQELVKYRIDHGQNPDFSDVEKSNPRILNLEIGNSNMLMDADGRSAAEIDGAEEEEEIQLPKLRILTKFQQREKDKKLKKRERTQDRRKDRRQEKRELKKAGFSHKKPKGDPENYLDPESEFLDDLQNYEDDSLLDSLLEEEAASSL